MGDIGEMGELPYSKSSTKYWKKFYDKSSFSDCFFELLVFFFLGGILNNGLSSDYLLYYTLSNWNYD